MVLPSASNFVPILMKVALSIDFDLLTRWDIDHGLMEPTDLFSSRRGNFGITSSHKNLEGNQYLSYLPVE